MTHGFENDCRCNYCKEVLSRVPSKRHARRQFAAINPGTFIESSYVYAPYVPLQVTQTIFSPKDCLIKSQNAYVKSVLSHHTYKVKAE